MKRLINIRKASNKDSSLILDFIKKLAEYEKRLDRVKAKESDIADILFTKKIAEALILEFSGYPVGFVIFFYNLSTFEGKPGIYIEDIYIDEDHRNKGMGKILFSYIARLALKRGCCKVEWSVLRWNKSSIRFYESLGAQKIKEWDIYLLKGKGLKKVSEMPHQKD